MSTISITPEEKKKAYQQINKAADQVINYAIWAYFAFGIMLSFFYDTYLIAFGVSGICLIAYYLTKMLLPNSVLYQYVLSALLGILAAQFIYQMHGLFEMHFFFFVASTLLIIYQNWKLQIPLLLFVLIHHSSFAYLQYTGMKEIYFTQLDYMDLQAFLFHAGIAGVIIFICGGWSYVLEKRTINEWYTTSALEQQLKNVKLNIAFAEEISKGNLQAEHDVSNDDELGHSLVRMQKNLLDASAREYDERYITTGIADIGEILRRHTADIKALAEELVPGIVKYLNANQGALFLLEEENGEQYLHMKACYAYSRKKYIDGRIDIGQGIVGQCFLEREIIFMTNVPDNYMRITSG